MYGQCTARVITSQCIILCNTPMYMYKSVYNVYVTRGVTPQEALTQRN